MKGLLSALLIFLIIPTKAQFVEKIYLKDSITVYTGWGVEQVPQDYLKILRQSERDTITVLTDKIWKIVRVLNARKDNLFSSSPKAGNNQCIYLEGGGAAFLYSLNYDFRLKNNRRDKWGLRGGFGVVGINVKDEAAQKVGRATLIIVPMQLNYLIGAKRGALELGAGGTSLIATGKLDTANNYYFENFKKRDNYFYFSPTITIGYRYTSLKNGLMFRVSVTPALFDGEILPSVGLSLGYAFTKNKKHNSSLPISTKR